MSSRTVKTRRNLPETVPDPPIAVYASEGHRLICALPVRNVAARLDITRQALSKWRRGECGPGPKMRETIKALYNIPPSAWDRLPTGAIPVDEDEPDEDDGPDDMPATSYATSHEADADEHGAEDLSVEWHRMIKAIRTRLKQPDILASERMKLHEQLSRALEKLARYQRDREMLEDRTIREHPMWRRLKSAISEALLKHPAAARDVEAAIITLIGRGRGADNDNEEEP